MLRQLGAWLRLNWARNWLAGGGQFDWSSRTWLAPALQFADLRAVVERGGPVLSPYERLAANYESYGDRLSRRYPSYLRAVAAYHQQSCQSVLDLACGCGELVRALAKNCRRVVGVDSSPAMLARAREACRDLPHVSFVQADFLRFDLGETLDAACCTSDALNYIPRPDALHDVFAIVARHVRPGGLFVFDVLTDAALRLLSGQYFHCQTVTGHFGMSYNYDAQTRRERTDVIFSDVLEQHHRVPIEGADVRAAAAATGFDVIEDFTADFPRTFYALQRVADR